MERTSVIKAVSLLPLTTHYIDISVFDLFTAKSLSTERMPALFVGYGSPMNAVETNNFTEKWEDIGKRLPNLKPVLIVSAHWFTHGTHITAMNLPKKINDFGGFPKALFESCKTVHFP